MRRGRKRGQGRWVRWLACAGCGLVLAACTASQPSIAVVWVPESRPPLYPVEPQPPSAMIVRWDPKGVSDAQAEAVAERRCLAWNDDARPEGAKVHSGTTLTQRYVCVAAAGGRAAGSRGGKPSS